MDWIDRQTFELIKVIFQFLLLGIIGGAITRYYSKLQKDREARTSLLKEFASIHGKFISLRYRYNSFHVLRKEYEAQTTHPLNEEEIRLKRWEFFQDACDLIGEFQGIKPLLFTHFPSEKENFNSLHQSYQQWRRRIIRNKPVLQEVGGANEEEFKKLRDAYLWSATRMKSHIK